MEGYKQKLQWAGRKECEVERSWLYTTGGGWGRFVKWNVGLLITLGLLPSPERTVSQQRSWNSFVSKQQADFSWPRIEGLTIDDEIGAVSVVARQKDIVCLSTYTRFQTDSYSSYELTSRCEDKFTYADFQGIIV